MSDIDKIVEILEQYDIKIKDLNRFGLPPNSYKRLAQEIHALDGWVSVEDRLPENDNKVFVCSLNSINGYAYPYDYHDAVSTGFYSEAAGWFYEDFSERCEDDDNGITHWKPLPEPPKD